MTVVGVVRSRGLEKMVEIKPYNEAETQKTLPAIEVHTYPKTTDPSVTLALVIACHQGAPDQVTWTKIVDKEPMSHEEAMAKAKEYAEEASIEVIFEKKTTD